MQTTDLIDGRDDFEIYVPGVVDILKSNNVEDERPIGGYCSTEHLDRQDEVVLAKGLDFTEFLKYGYFNDNHKQDTSAALGYPTMAELRQNRWWTQGNLIKGYKPADDIWALAKALKKSNAPRRLGFSIEGKVQERGFDNRIVKAKIRHVAITNSPVNTECTWDVLTKAFASYNEVDAAHVHADTPSLLKVSFDDAVTLVKKSRPGYSWGHCEQLVRILYSK